MLSNNVPRSRDWDIVFLLQSITSLLEFSCYVFGLSLCIVISMCFDVKRLELFFFLSSFPTVRGTLIFCFFLKAHSCLSHPFWSTWLNFL